MIGHNLKVAAVGAAIIEHNCLTDVWTQELESGTTTHDLFLVKGFFSDLNLVIFFPTKYMQKCI